MATLIMRAARSIHLCVLDNIFVFFEEVWQFLALIADYFLDIFQFYCEIWCANLARKLTRKPGVSPWKIKSGFF